MKFIISIFLIIALSGCETFGTKITEEQLSKIDKVALVSLIGDQIAYNYVGVTAFNNKNTLYPFPDINIDKYITTKISHALKRANPRVDIVRLDNDFDTLMDSYSSRESITSFDMDRFIAKITDEALGKGINYIIVASRDNIQFDEAPVAVHGFGLRKRVGRDVIGSFVLVKFQLIDISTKKELAKARVFERDRESKFQWKEPYDANSESVKEKLKSYIYKSIDDWSKGVASLLIQSPKDFNICSNKVYSTGFEIDGITYKSREEVLEERRKHIYQKIVREDIHPKKSKPPYEEKFKSKEDEVLDCIGQLVQNA
jgi:hypothetical protein